MRMDKQIFFEGNLSINHDILYLTVIIVGFVIESFPRKLLCRGTPVLPSWGWRSMSIDAEIHYDLYLKYHKSSHFLFLYK